MKITVETVVNAKVDDVWQAWNDPAAIKEWNSPHESWHTTSSAVDLREGGRFLARMEAKDGSTGFDFEGKLDRLCYEFRPSETAPKSASPWRR